jgi:hypothetical protein
MQRRQYGNLLEATGSGARLRQGGVPQKAVEHEKLVIKDAWPITATSIATLHLLALVFWQSGKFAEAVETFKTLFEASEVVWEVMASSP